jgi:hypothetical protein
MGVMVRRWFSRSDCPTTRRLRYPQSNWSSAGPLSPLSVCALGFCLRPPPPVTMELNEEANWWQGLTCTVQEGLGYIQGLWFISWSATLSFALSYVSLPHTCVWEQDNVFLWKTIEIYNDCRAETYAYICTRTYTYTWIRFHCCFISLFSLVVLYIWCI